MRGCLLHLLQTGRVPVPLPLQKGREEEAEGARGERPNPPLSPRSTQGKEPKRV